MTYLVMIGLDLVAIVVLTVFYFVRHRRRDLVIAFLTVNVGVLAVTMALGGSSVGVGLGLGLFGVLSIIRLRSSEIAQHEVAYYFAALAIGLVAGLGGASSTGFDVLDAGLIALVLAVMIVGDQPRLLRRYRQQTVVLDSAIADETRLRAALEELLGAEVVRVAVQRLDTVDDTTTAEVRYRLPQRGTGTGR